MEAGHWPEPPRPEHLGSQRLSPLHPTSLLQGPGSLPCAPPPHTHPVSSSSPSPCPGAFFPASAIPATRHLVRGGVGTDWSSLAFLSTLMGPARHINSRRTGVMTTSLKAGFPASGPADTLGWTTLLWAHPVCHGVVSSISGLNTHPRGLWHPLLSQAETIRSGSRQGQTPPTLPREQSHPWLKTENL